MRGIFLLSVLFYCCDYPANGQGTHNERVDLRSRWMVFHDNAYVPYRDEGSVIHFNVGRNERMDTLFVRSAESVSIFVNHQAVATHIRYWKSGIDVLFEKYPGHSMTISLYFPGGRVPGLHTSIARADANGTARIGGHSTSDMHDFYWLAYLVFAISIAYLYHRNRRGFLRYLKMPAYLSQKGKLSNRVDVTYNLQFGVFSTIVWAFLATLVQAPFDFLCEHPFADLMGYWLMAIGLLLVLVALKALWAYILAWMFEVKGLSGLMTLMVGRLWAKLGLFFVAVLLLVILLPKAYPGQLYNYLNVGAVIILLGYSYVFVALIKNKKLRTLHLFSYFCVSEIVPLVTLVAILFD